MIHRWCVPVFLLGSLVGGNIAARVGQPPTLLDAVDTGEGWFNHSQILQFDHNSGDR